MSSSTDMPAWADYVLLPLINLLLAFVLSGLVVLAIGEDPVRAMRILVEGAIGYPEAIAFTLYYATNFIFTGLAVALAFHAGLFNIGGEGQAYVAGLGVALICLYLDFLPWPIIFVGAIALGMAFGAVWAAIPGWLQAKRGSHVVITTIMFNFIAAALMTYLLSNVMLEPGRGAPETRRFIANATLPSMQTMLGWIGIDAPRSPLNFAFFIAIGAAFLVYVYIWRTRWGYALRVVGQNEQAARYAGIDPAKTIIVAMAISGALAGLMGVNEIMGAHQRLLVAFTGGFGFVGIAVALMGRNHPLGVCLAALLFGALYQGGAELAFEMRAISREMVVVIQGLIILFCGALENMFRPWIASLFARRKAA